MEIGRRDEYQDTMRTHRETRPSVGAKTAVEAVKMRPKADFTCCARVWFTQQCC